MIIVEGPDNAGKTTLINRLVSDLGLVKAPLKFEPLDKPDVGQAVKQYYDEVIVYLKNSNPVDLANVVWDRMYFSELVYGPLKRQGVQMTPEQVEEIDKLITSLKPLILVCTTDIDTIKSTLDERVQYMKEEEIQQVIDAYDYLYNNMKTFTPYHFKYNYKTDDYDALKRFVSIYVRAMS